MYVDEVGFRNSVCCWPVSRDSRLPQVEVNSIRPYWAIRRNIIFEQWPLYDAYSLPGFQITAACVSFFLNQMITNCRDSADNRPCDRDCCS